MGEKSKGYVFIAIAGLLWATLGLFGKFLMGNGLTSEQVAFTRLFFGFIVLGVYSSIRTPQILKISKKGIIYSVIIGIICQAMFNLCYFKAIDIAGVSIAAVLLYTSPLFLAIFSKICYKENITRSKLFSLILCFIGAIMAVTGGRLDFQGLNAFGLLLGVLSAIAYALMPTISKNALKEFSSSTILVYSFLFGAIFMIPSSRPWEILNYAKDLDVLSCMLMLGIVPAALAYIFYAAGISKGVELSVAGVVASVELVGSVIIGCTILGESFSLGKLFGVMLMLISAVVALNLSYDEIRIFYKSNKLKQIEKTESI
ncbi:TPA: EamA family transporter [Clostridioides difficile]|uniref:EamA family transporter n=7 Tax=Clostridioides difficile TaxID=1496 RepID=A0A6N4MQ14_CLODI|nr:DMT family transporter [Clostridioides difficile]EQG61492.1 eamA-like transporter family protein [Clostridioides difficile DA00149]EQG77570.1 eamA-like transporter family protein [Clostridioides difficile DA00165]EQK92687.1 eamA-like transporter family protein [Clostridioides difficile CD127]AKP42356.1 membrane protein [Clostridioides difficile ATCC 9689 = DSM 1296]AMM56760.1 membrane protein [Clostridioides difficile]